MNRLNIIKQVQVRLDELSPFDDTEEVPAIDYIDKLLDYSTDRVFRLLPYTKLPCVDNSLSRVTKVGDLGEYSLMMIDRYIKLGECKFDAWVRPVTKVASPFIESLQGSKYTMGKPNKPVITERKVGDLIELHFFSIPDGGPNPTKRLSIVISKKPEDCPENLIDAITWQCAADVLSSLGKESKYAQEKVLTYGL